MHQQMMCLSPASRTTLMMVPGCVLDMSALDVTSCHAHQNAPAELTCVYASSLQTTRHVHTVHIVCSNAKLLPDAIIKHTPFNSDVCHGVVATTAMQWCMYRHTANCHDLCCHCTHSASAYTSDSSPQQCVFSLQVRYISIIFSTTLNTALHVRLHLMHTQWEAEAVTNMCVSMYA